MTFWPSTSYNNCPTDQTFHFTNFMTLIPRLTFDNQGAFSSLPSTNYEWSPWSICNGCDMPDGNAYHSGYLALTVIYCPPPFAKAGDIKTHLSVCLSVRPSVRLSVCHKNFNLAHIFWSINDRALILGMHDHCDLPYLLVPCSDLDHDLWPISRSNLLPGGGPQFFEFLRLAFPNRRVFSRLFTLKIPRYFLNFASAKCRVFLSVLSVPVGSKKIYHTFL